MKTKIVYFDESGDDGNNTMSSGLFILTSLAISSESWQDGFDICRKMRKHLRETYGFSLSHEFHTKDFLQNKYPYSKYNWTPDQQREIIRDFTVYLSEMDVSIISVIVDKEKIKSPDTNILEIALKYNIQRVENSFGGEWNYIAITDPGRTGSMRKTARKIRVYNPIPSHYGSTRNMPIKCMVEDILEKDSKESYFIQICDFMTYIVRLYYKIEYQKSSISGRTSRVLSAESVYWIMDKLKNNRVLNIKATHNDPYGIVICPQKNTTSTA